MRNCTKKLVKGWVIPLAVCILLFQSCRGPTSVDTGGANNKVYAVTFITDTSDKIEIQWVKENGTVTQPKELKKDGYEFKGWFKHGDQKAWNFTSNTVKAPLTLYAKWEKISKQPDPKKPDTPTDKPKPSDDEKKLEEKQLEKPKVHATGADTAIMLEWQPIENAQSYSVKLWEKDQKSPIEEKMMPASNTKICYEKKSLKNDTTYSFSVTAMGQTIGHVVYKNSEATEGTVTPKGNTVIVSFNTEGGEEVQSQECKINEKIKRPTNEPKKTGYKFGGWYKDQEYKEEWDFEKETVTKNITLYAKWTPEQYTVTLVLNGGKFEKGGSEEKQVTKQIPYGNVIEDLKEEPVKGNCNFDGWFTDPTFKPETEWDISNKVTKELTLYAKWALTDEEIKVGSTSFMMVIIPAPEEAKEIQQTYSMGETEVTEALYYTVMNTGNHGSQKPVSNITWYDMVVFCNELTKKVYGDTTACVYYSDASLQTLYVTSDAKGKKQVYYNKAKQGFRLPTEAEWKWALQGGEPQFKYAGSNNAGEVAWYEKNSKESRWIDHKSKHEDVCVKHNVKEKNANGYGLYDMCGNISEWCWTDDNSGLVWAQLCGGAYQSKEEKLGQSFMYSGDKQATIGFRIACNR